MKHKNMTFSVPEDIVILLHNKVSKRGMSRFISQAIRKAIKEKELQDEKELDAAYEAANKDKDRLEILQDWDALDDISDLADNEEDWSWLKNA